MMQLFVYGLIRQSDEGDSGSGGDGAEQAVQAASGLSLTDWLIAGAILVGGLVATVLAAKIVRKLVARRNEMVATLIGRIVGTIVFVTALVAGLNSIGVPVAPLFGGLSIAGLAVAFALRSILNNLLAGILIQIRQPFRIGHLVKLDGYFGKIEAISLRTVDMTTVDGEYVMIPAGTVVENAIENWTTNGERREEVIIGIDYEADIATAVDGIKTAVRDLDVILDRDVKVVIDALGDSSVNLKILAWHDVKDHFLDVKHAIAKAAKEWCDANDVGMPSPQRELIVRDAGALASSPQGPNGDIDETSEQSE